MKKIITAICIIIMLSFATVSAAGVTFTDVDRATPMGSAIYKLADKGIVIGYGDNTFRPDGYVTRAELVKMVNLVFNYTESDATNFNDVKDTDWFYPYTLIAKKAGYIAGYEDGSFRGNNNLTRQETCVIITRVGGLYELPFMQNINDEVAEWALPYVRKVLANRFMSLEEGNTFRATENITRGELAQVLASFVIDTPVITPTPSTPTSPSGPSGNGNNSSNDKDDDKVTPGDNANDNNTGNENTGNENTGNENTGNENTGNENTGNENTGNENTGNENTGNENTGNENTGNENTGNENTGNENTGNENTGNENTGNENTGNENTGNEEDEEPVLDIKKQAAVLGKIDDMLLYIRRTRFESEYEVPIINIIRSTLNSVKADADRNVIIYADDYVKTTYATDIAKAKALYDALDPTRKSDFESRLLSNFPLETVDELLYIFFDKRLEDFV